MIVKLPALAGVTLTSVVLSGEISVSILNGLDMKPCTRSVLVSLKITGSPFLSVISLGVNWNLFALISITFGLTAALARLVFGATAANVIPHAAAKSVAATILCLNILGFIVLLVVCVSASMFEHLIHPDRTRILGPRELHFLDLQIAAVGLAVNAPQPQVLERLRLVEGHRFLHRRRRRVGESEDQRSSRVHFRSAGLVKVLAMNMAVEHGYVFVRCERVHHLVAVAGEPFPLGLEIEQRTMRKHDDGRGFRKAGEIGLHPGELRRSYLGPAGGDVIECDEVNAAMVERVMGGTDEFTEHHATVERGVILARHELDLCAANFARDLFE